ncbi:MAG: hypothetical protein Q7U10_03475 [Thermodesulfovibrionia bacterium]|nr:hypothetical protein [Thermodesulfovibrionia bacterium]
MMPIGGKTDKHPEFAIKFKGNEVDCERAIELCSSLAQYDHSDIVKTVCDVVQQVTLNLAWYGYAVHEIIRDDEDNSKYHLYGFTSKRLFRLPRYFIQWVPKQDYEYLKKRYVIIPSTDIWEISIPSALGGASGYKNMLLRLKRFEHIGPKFWRSDLENQIQTKGYNFQEYVLTTESYYRKITKHWGWNRRDHSQRNCTEFFTIYKGITFRWAQAILREHIISEINKLLSRLQINAKIVIAGIPLADDILRIRQELVDGKIDFQVAYDKSSI